MSSTGTGDLALLIKGLLVALVPLTVNAFRTFGIDLAESFLVEFIESVFAAIAAVMIVVGLVRKGINRIPPTEIE
jgi:hypothetical protein